jgi:hypothetical protein
VTEEAAYFMTAGKQRDREGKDLRRRYVLQSYTPVTYFLKLGPTP